MKQKEKLQEKFKLSLGKLVEAAKEVTAAEQAFLDPKSRKSRTLRRLAKARRRFSNKKKLTVLGGGGTGR